MNHFPYASIVEKKTNCNYAISCIFRCMLLLVFDRICLVGISISFIENIRSSEKVIEDVDDIDGLDELCQDRLHDYVDQIHNSPFQNVGDRLS